MLMPGKSSDSENSIPVSGQWSVDGGCRSHGCLKRGMRRRGLGRVNGD